MIKNILTIFFIYFSVLVQAQEPVSINLTEKFGLPDKEFYNLIEDDKGFIWLCANKGLFRYDGKEYKRYTHEIQKGASIFGVQQDPLGRIWCNNISGQFFYVKDQKLLLFTNLSKLLKGELANFIVAEKYLWVFVSRSIYKIDLETKVLDVINRSSPEFNTPLQIKNTIFYRDKDAIFKITSKGEITSLSSVIEVSKNTVKNRITYKKTKFFNQKDNLYERQNIAGINMFFRVDLVAKKLDKIVGFDAVSRESIYNEYIHNNEVWLATNSGVWVYEINKNSAILKRRFLKEIDVTKIIKDKDANYWLTTLNNGIYILPNLFIETTNLPLKNKNITCLEKINDSLFVLGTDKGIILKYDLYNHQKKIIKIPTKSRVAALKYHSNYNTLFISTDKKGLEYNLKTRELKKIRDFRSAKSIEVLKNNDLFYVDYANITLLNRKGLKKRKLLSSGTRGYTSYYNTVNENIYVGLIDNLIVYNKQFEKKIISYKNKPIYAKSITKTANGVIWVATFKQGVFGVRNNKVIKHYNNTDKLKSNTIQKIKGDKNNLWIVLNNAIQVLDISTEKVKTLTKTDGVISYDISGIEIVKNKVYFSSNEGLFSVDKEKNFKRLHPEVYFNQFAINDKDTLVTTNYQLRHNQNNIKIGFNVNGFAYNQKEKYKYRLKGLNNQWFTTVIGETTVKYNSLPAGKYIFEVQSTVENKEAKKSIKQLSFTIKQPFWETWWFTSSMILIFIGTIVLFYRRKFKRNDQQRLRELEKISLEKELISMNLTALRAQMNPHFVFNALNSIQDYIIHNQKDLASDYLGRFADLIRMYLNQSTKKEMTLFEEIDTLKRYLELEKLRFEDKLKYNILVEKDIVTNDYVIPTMLIQPYIENALKHGLLHKKGGGKLEISFKFNKEQSILICIITDDGIGRKRSKIIQNKRKFKYKSFATKATQEKLRLLNYNKERKITILVEDLVKDEQVDDLGTKVTIQIPIDVKYIKK